MPFLQFTAIIVNDLIMCSDASLCRLLADDVEVIMIANNLCVYESSWWHIFGFIWNGKGSLTIPDHHEGQFDLAPVVTVELIYNYLSKSSFNLLKLISWDRKHEYN